MRRKWFITEKIISVALVIGGSLLFYSTSIGLFNLISILHSKDFSVVTTFKSFHIVFFLSLMTIFGGVFLFFNKRISWLISLITLILNGFIYLIPPNRHTHIFSSKHLDIILIRLLMTITCLTVFVILFQKPFLAKYNPTKKTWLTIALISFAIVFDRTLIFLFSQSF